MRKRMIAIAALALPTLIIIFFTMRMDGAVTKPAATENGKTVNAAEPRTLRFASGAPQLAYVRVEPVQESPEPVSDPIASRIAYNEDFTARVSSPIAGRVVRLGAEIGDKVRAGQTLLWLDAPDYGSAMADFRKSASDLKQKDRAYQRARELYDGEVLARKDLESAETDLAQSRAEYARSKARLENLGAPGESADVGNRFTLRAPITGVVVDRQANPGMEVRPDAASPLFVITDPTRLWVLIDLSEHELAKVHRGQPVLIETDAYPGLRVPSRIAVVGETLDPATRKAQARCLLANPDRRFKPEMFARVTLLADSGRQVIQIPNTALVTEGLNQYVFVEKSPGILEKRQVMLSRQGQDTSIVTDGLSAGARIATRGALLLNSEFAGGNR